MKKLLCLLWVAGCWYLAAMYRSLPLLVLGVCGAGMLVCAFLTPYFLSRKVRVSFPRELFFLKRGAWGGVTVTAESLGRLPLGKVTFGFRLPGKKKRKKIAIPRLSGQQALTIPVSTDVCGLHPVILRRVKVFDYLGLFSHGRRKKLRAKAAVFPAAPAMDITLPENFFPHLEGEGTPQMALAGSSTQEVRQIRDYQPGDSYRTIHWKQSARTDTLMVREYAKEGKRSLTVALDMASPKPLPPARRNAFYEVVQSLLLGLVGQEVVVQLWWNHREGTECLQVAGEGDCREALLRLYETGGFFSGEKKMLPREGFFLDSSLTLSFREEKIFGFSPKNYENELKMPMDWREIPWAGR